MRTTLSPEPLAVALPKTHERSLRGTIAAYYRLAKPGIVYGNGISAAAGFFVASVWRLDMGLFVSMLVGLSCIIASGCAFNNYIDRDIDAVMARTKSRALVAGVIAPASALWYGSVLLVLGSFLLFVYTNLLAALAALFGWGMYVGAYSLWGKRKSVLGTHIGAISGAVPPVVGYVAVTGRLDIGAGILFLILFFWQMPHFFAIALRRANDYRAAGVPAVPLVRSVRETRVQIISYIVATGIAVALLTAFGYAGVGYFVASLAACLWWLSLALRGFRALDQQAWAKKVFLASLTVLLVICIAMALNPTAPARSSFIHLGRFSYL